MSSRDQIIRIFKNVVKEKFKYLEKEYNLDLVQVDENTFLINTELANIKILLLEGHNYDINILVKPKKGPQTEFGIKTILEFLDKKNYLGDKFESPLSLLKLINDYAEVFRNEVLSLVLNNKIDWNKLSYYVKGKVEKQRKIFSERKECNQINTIKNEALNAFKNKKYKEVVQLLTSIRNDLSSADQKMFNYSLKKCVTKKYL